MSGRERGWRGSGSELGAVAVGVQSDAAVARCVWTVDTGHTGGTRFARDDLVPGLLLSLGVAVNVNSPRTTPES